MMTDDVFSDSLEVRLLKAEETIYHIREYANLLSQPADAEAMLKVGRVARHLKRMLGDID